MTNDTPKDFANIATKLASRLGLNLKDANINTIAGKHGRHASN